VIGMFMNECIDSTIGRIHVCFAVLLASDDPRTSWSFQLVRRSVSLHWSNTPASRTFQSDVCVLPILNCTRVVMVPTGRIIRWKLEAKSYS
jgi:hypothetical protein